MRSANFAGTSGLHYSMNHDVNYRDGDGHSAALGACLVVICAWRKTTWLEYGK